MLYSLVDQVDSLVNNVQGTDCVWFHQAFRTIGVVADADNTPGTIVNSMVVNKRGLSVCGHPDALWIY